MPSPAIDIHIVQLLFSRLCHDLAGPIGAINNGLELVADVEDDDEEALDLIAQSARQAATDLEFARLAFGFGGGSGGSYAADAERLCKAMFANERVRVAWRSTADADLSKDAVKLLMNMSLVGQQVLRGRGSLVIDISRPGQGYRIAVTAEGPGAAMNPGLREALAGAAGSADLTPATSQGYFVNGLSQLVGGSVEIDETEPERIVLSVVTSENEEEGSH
jgi:histidine phosphotransferase ChpT